MRYVKVIRCENICIFWVRIFLLFPRHLLFSTFWHDFTQIEHLLQKWKKTSSCLRLNKLVRHARSKTDKTAASDAISAALCQLLPCCFCVRKKNGKHCVETSKNKSHCRNQHWFLPWKSKAFKTRKTLKYLQNETFYLFLNTELELQDKLDRRLIYKAWKAHSFPSFSHIPLVVIWDLYFSDHNHTMTIHSVPQLVSIKISLKPSEMRRPNKSTKVKVPTNLSFSARIFWVDFFRTF